MTPCKMVFHTRPQKRSIYRSRSANTITPFTVRLMKHYIQDPDIKWNVQVVIPKKNVKISNKKKCIHCLGDKEEGLDLTHRCVLFKKEDINRQYPYQQAIYEFPVGSPTSTVSSLGDDNPFY